MPKSSSSSSPIINAGRALFALAILGFGLQYVLLGRLHLGLPLCPNWLPDGRLIAYALAALLVAAGVALLVARRTLAVSLGLGLLLLCTSFLYLQHANFVLHTAEGRTSFLEALSFAAAALMLHGLAAGVHGRFTLMPGRILFAFAMIVFGAQHFMYTRFIARLVPGWMPQHTFFVLITGAAMIAAGLSIATMIADKAAGFGLFALFFGWLVLLHAPRIVHALHNGNEWSSGFVVLGLSGASLLLAASSRSS